jgi:hypothetical protein
VTKDSSGVKEVEVVSKPIKVPRICLPIKAAQLCCAKAVKKKREFDRAFKRAMVIYDHVQHKPDGMSAQIAINLIKNKLGVQLSRQKIQKKVKDENILMSSLQQGLKRNIPNCHYHNLCMA